MTRCAWCRKTIWPWQGSVNDIAGREHVGCWRSRYQALEDHGGLSPDSRYFWEAVLMAPPDVSARMLDRADVRHQPEP